MADVFSAAKRSAIMASVRGTGNRSTELRLIAIFDVAGIRGWRRGVLLPGNPDFVFPKSHVVVFVDGCFWHGCPIHATHPRSNAAYWSTKIARNRARDRSVNRTLRAMGWRVLRIWEHALHQRKLPRTLARLRRALTR